MNFAIKQFTDRPSCDGSYHYRMMSDKRYVDFAISDGELSAYIWQVEGQELEFLKELEHYAENHNLKLTIPNVLSLRLQKILEDNGYSMKEVPYMGDVIELWSKDKSW